MMLKMDDFLKYVKAKRKKKNPKYEFITDSLDKGRNVEISENGVIKYLTIIDGRLVALTPKNEKS